MKTILTAIALCLALLAAGCGDDSETGSADSGNAEAAADGTTTEGSSDGAAEGTPQTTTSTDTSKKPKVVVPEGAPPTELIQSDVVEGSGPVIKKNDEVSVHYVGFGYERGKEFDGSWDRGKPFPFVFGGGQVIPGWEEGLVGMKVGGRRELIIPPDLAYGSAGAPPSIGPNETLIFVVDVVKIN